MRITAWWLRWTSFYGHDIWVTYDDVTMTSLLNMTSNTCQFDQIRGLKLVQTHINAQYMPWRYELQKLEPVRSLRFVPLSKKVQIHLRALIWKILVRVYWMGKHELWREGGVEKRGRVFRSEKASQGWLWLAGLCVTDTFDWSTSDDFCPRLKIWCHKNVKNTPNLESL